MVQDDNKTMFTQNNNDPPVLGYLRTQRNNIPRVTHRVYSTRRASSSIVSPLLCTQRCNYFVPTLTQNSLKVTRRVRHYRYYPTSEKYCKQINKWV